MSKYKWAGQDIIHISIIGIKKGKEYCGTTEPRYHSWFHFAMSMATFLAILMVVADLNRGAEFHREWPCHKKESTRILVGGASLSANLALDRAPLEPARSKRPSGEPDFRAFQVSSATERVISASNVGNPASNSSCFTSTLSAFRCPATYLAAEFIANCT